MVFCWATISACHALLSSHMTNKDDDNWDNEFFSKGLFFGAPCMWLLLCAAIMRKISNIWKIKLWCPELKTSLLFVYNFSYPGACKSPRIRWKVWSLFIRSLCPWCSMLHLLVICTCIRCLWSGALCRDNCKVTDGFQCNLLLFTYYCAWNFCDKKGRITATIWNMFTHSCVVYFCV